MAFAKNARNDDFIVHVHRGQCRAMSCKVLNFAYSLQSYNIIIYVYDNLCDQGLCKVYSISRFKD